METEKISTCKNNASQGSIQDGNMKPVINAKQNSFPRKNETTSTLHQSDDALA